MNTDPNRAVRPDRVAARELVIPDRRAWSIGDGGNARENPRALVLDQPIQNEGTPPRALVLGAAVRLPLAGGLALRLHPGWRVELAACTERQGHEHRLQESKAFHRVSIYHAPAFLTSGLQEARGWTLRRPGSQVPHVPPFTLLS